MRILFFIFIAISVVSCTSKDEQVNDVAFDVDKQLLSSNSNRELNPGEIPYELNRQLDEFSLHPENHTTSEIYTFISTSEDIGKPFFDNMAKKVLYVLMERDNAFNELTDEELYYLVSLNAYIKIPTMESVIEISTIMLDRGYRQCDKLGGVLFAVEQKFQEFKNDMPDVAAKIDAESKLKELEQLQNRVLACNK